MCIKEAITEAGGPTVVAERFEIKPPSVLEWIDRNKLPSSRIIPLAELTNFKYTPHQLDPILYPNPTDGIPPAELVHGEVRHVS